VLSEAAGSSTVETTPVLPWQAALADTLVEAGASVAAYVPDTRLQGILAHLGGRSVPLRSLTREEECVAYAAGQRIAGRRPVVLLQSSGLGNCLNALASLAVPYRLGLPLIISMRGTLGEANPSQIPIGRAALPFLAAVGIQAFSLRHPDDATQLMKGVCTLAYEAAETAALILEPELGGGRAAN